VAALPIPARRLSGRSCVQHSAVAGRGPLAFGRAAWHPRFEMGAVVSASVGDVTCIVQVARPAGRGWEPLRAPWLGALRLVSALAHPRCRSRPGAVGQAPV